MIGKEISFEAVPKKKQLALERRRRRTTDGTRGGFQPPETLCPFPHSTESIS